MSKNTKIILVVLILAVVTLVAYVYVASQDGDSTSQRVQAVDPALTAELVETLTSLNATRFDTDVFNRQDYLVLKDNTLTIQSRPLGRDNPFLPPEQNVEIEVSRTADLRDDAEQATQNN